MPRVIKVAAIQMDANPAPTADRLARAERLVAAAAETGAQLIVLPETFNTGYGYTDENYSRAEPIGGLTARWMKETSARHGIHLAGSLLLLDQNHVYNALLLFAPDGRMWRYDKNYPWAYERHYFRGGREVTVAGTELGDLGLMICWDIAHPKMWRRYAGQVDMMVITSCPPDASNPTYHFPGGNSLGLDDLGSMLASLKGLGQAVFGDSLNRQTAWLKVPTVHTTSSGRITTDIPNSLLALASVLPLAPRLVKYLSQARGLQMSCDMIPGCKVVDVNGRILAEVTPDQGETFVVAEVTLPNEKSYPRESQPPAPLPRLGYLSADVLMPLIATPGYKRGVRRVLGREPADGELPMQRRILAVSLAVVAAIGIGIVLGTIWRYKNNQG